MKKICLTLVLVLIVAVPGWAKYWYAAPSGTNGDGSESSPWVGFSNIVWGNGGVDTGDTLWLMPGTYNEQLTVGASGSSGAYITIRGDYGGGKAVISGFASYTAGWTDEGSGIYSRPYTLVGSDVQEEEQCFVVTETGENLAHSEGNYLTLSSLTWDFEVDKIYINPNGNANEMTIYLTNRLNGIRCISKSYIIIRNLIIQGAFEGIFIQDSSNVYVMDVTSKLNSFIQIYSLTSTYVHLLRCRCFAYRPDTGNTAITARAISVYGGHHNEIIDCVGAYDRRGLDLYAGASPNDQAYSRVIGGQYHHNTVDSFDADGVTVTGTGDSNLTDNARIMIIGVEAFNNADQGIDCVQGRNVVVKYCISHHNDGSLGTGLGRGDGYKGGSFNSTSNGFNSNNTFLYCLAYSNSKNGFYNDGQGNNFINCTSIENGEAGFELRHSDGDYTVKNCIGFNNGLAGIWWRTSDLGSGEIDYNCWAYTVGTAHCAIVGSDETDPANQYDSNDFSSYATRVTPSEIHSMFSSPLLTSTYHLTHNSPCIDAGTKVTGIHDQDDWKDLDGHVIHYGSNPDIGCYEYNTNFIKRWGRARWNIGKWGRGKWGGARW